MYPITQNGELWPMGSLWGVKILNGVKIFVTFFSKMVSLISMKFGMMGALGVAGLKRFW